MTEEKPTTFGIEEMLKRDCFGFGEEGEYEWLREHVEVTFPILRVLHAKILSQVEVATNNRDHGLEIDVEWFRKIVNLEARLKARVVEFEVLYAAQRRSDLRSAIRRHRSALIASGGKPAAYDETLWASIGEDE